MDRITFHEFEAYTESVKDADMRCTLPRLELPIWSIQNLSIEKMHLQFASEGCGNIAEGATRPDGCILFVPLSGTQARGNGKLMNQDAPLLLGPKTEFRICFEHAHDWFSLFVPEELLVPPSLRDRDASSILPKSGRVIHPNAALLERLRSFVDRLNSAAEMEPAVLTEPNSLVEVRNELSGMFREIMGIASDLETPSIGRPAVVREHIIRTALDRIVAMEELPTCFRRASISNAAKAFSFLTTFKASLNPRFLIDVYRGFGKVPLTRIMRWLGDGPWDNSANLNASFDANSARLETCKAPVSGRLARRKKRLDLGCATRNAKPQTPWHVHPVINARAGNASAHPGYVCQYRQIAHDLMAVIATRMADLKDALLRQPTRCRTANSRRFDGNVGHDRRVEPFEIGGSLWLRKVPDPCKCDCVHRITCVVRVIEGQCEKQSSESKFAFGR